MTDKQPIFLVLDGNALLHRAWHALPPMTTKDGLVVNAAYGFAMITEKMIETFKPDYMAVAWDLPGGTFRDEIYKDYKAGREEKEQELYDQIDIIQEILEAFGIPSVEAAGFEADDIIGTLSAKASKKGYKTLIVTGDLDALQLVDDDVHVVFFIKGISQTKIYDRDAVQERYGLTPEQVIDYKALKGDSSDNIPGLKGVGDKTAAALLQAHETIDGIYKAIENDEVAEKFAKKFRGFEKDVEMSKTLVTIVRDMKLDFEFSSAKLSSPDFEKLLPLYKDLEFRTLIRKHSGAGGASEMPPPPIDSMDVDNFDGGEDVVVDGDIQIVRVGQEYSIEKFKGAPVGVLIAEQPADLFGATMAALSVSGNGQTIVLVNPSEEDLEKIFVGLSSAETLVTHDLKQLMHQVERRITFQAFDTMIASYLLNAGTRAHDLSMVIHNHIDEKVSEIPKMFAKEKDYQKFGQVTATLPRLALKMREALVEAGQEEVFDDIEMPLVPVLYQMEIDGIELDTDSLAVFSKSLAKRIDELSNKVTSLAGEEFNLNSPSQLAVIFFETLNLPTKGIKKTKTGYSTAASELEKLWNQHEIVPLIGEYRELAKLQSTYVEALPKLVKSDGRIHTTYNQAVAATGRLSSSEPNLQNIPIKTELGREIRKAFVVPKGKVLIAADYSQIELRLIAVLAKDKPFIRAFQDGADIHTRTASEVWEIAEEDVTKDQRRAAKAINFGIMYGMGPRSLSRSTGLSFSEAKEFIQKYFEIHTAVRDFMDETKALAHTQGYVETLFGRRRYFPEIDSGVPMLVASAERMAINHPLQGTASDLMKKAMLATDGWLRTSGWPAKMLLQVHDELVLECDKAAVEAVTKGLREMMEDVASFDVPLVVDVEVGKTWGDMSEID
ncbi:MAG: DNA polymerase I [Parcubacteria group bacterium]|nr:DNA polymerase I [Parcubacteria group bacterium]